MPQKSGTIKSNSLRVPKTAMAARCIKQGTQTLTTPAASALIAVWARKQRERRMHDLALSVKMTTASEVHFRFNSARLIGMRIWMAL